MSGKDENICYMCGEPIPESDGPAWYATVDGHKIHIHGTPDSISPKCAEFNRTLWWNFVSDSVGDREYKVYGEMLKSIKEDPDILYSL